MPQPTRTPVVVFAQTPPPEHGQSRMVLLGLQALQRQPEEFEVHHVNARFSRSLDEIGESSVGKLALTVLYLVRALRVRLRINRPLLYYVPGPVKWSAVLRDWILLLALRSAYSRIIFHWHAIGQGEWAHGSDRLRLPGPIWLDHLARRISAAVLSRPHGSICVSDSSQRDAIAVGSLHQWIVFNGVDDPVRDHYESMAKIRSDRQQDLTLQKSPCFRLLFLSHGTAEKGIIDALGSVNEALEHCDSEWSFHLTFAGGISDSVRKEFDSHSILLLDKWSDRLQIEKRPYLKGSEKNECFGEHDVFLSPSRWESFGLTVVEAMSHGMPIVAAASDGVAGVLSQDYRYLAPVADPPVLGQKLIDCCASLITSGSKFDLNELLRNRFLEYYQLQSFSETFSRTIEEAGRIDQQSTGIDARYEEVSDPRNSKTNSHDSGPRTAIGNHHPAVPVSGPRPPGVSITAYLADQNPGYDRSFGISRMSHVVLEALQDSGQITIEAITSRTSQQPPKSVGPALVLPWGTRRKWVRLLTDHFHPAFKPSKNRPDLHYYPKGYLPLLSQFCHPSVVTIHDTIIQYDEDHYPNWRSRFEYGYWALMLKHTLRHADRILTVSESSRNQVRVFMKRHGIPPKEITVTYEPCAYERLPQPENPAKDNYVIHLASVEPHKRTAHLIQWWHDAESQHRELPMLHLIGTVPKEVELLLTTSRSIVKRPFLEDTALRAAYQGARALVLPSEIEGFGLPALEAYYLGTPVCFVHGTSVEEILRVITNKGGFSLDAPESLFKALDEVMAMTSDEIRDCGIKLRETYAAAKVAERMMRVFEEVKG